ncbi:MAG TPA: hypothetical protein VNY34_03430 [Solirubrobacteraceae bacterium]|nr:hypothetical protein [Solirubrobacteraceae bacterium]
MSVPTRCVTLAVILAWQLSLVADAGSAGSAAQGWSAASRLSGCAAAIGPRVAFPSESPASATGPGAVVWAQDPACVAGRGASGAARSRFELALAALGPGERATATGSGAGASLSSGAIAAVGASLGRVAVAASLPADRGSAGELPAVLQGRATRGLDSRTPLAGAGSPLSLARAYLGDVAVATVLPGVAIEVRVERYFGHGFARPLRVPIGPGEVTALTATMDYRSDVLLGWQQEGSIYAHMLRASGRPEPTQRVGPSSPSPQLQALVSDNDHGMIAWSTSDPSGPGARTSVRLALSSAGVSFLPARVIASYADPAGVGSSSGSLQLVRLSTENVMLAWTDSESGHHVVRAVPAVFAGMRPSARLSDPAGEAVLADLAPGPTGEAVAIWRAATPPGSDFSRPELWAARAFIRRGGLAGARPAELVAGAGANAAPSVAVDPASDRAVAAWLTLGPHPSVQYASGPAASGYRPRAATVTLPRDGTHWLRISLAAAAGAAVLAVLIALALRRRAPSRPAGGGSRGRRPRR